MAPFFSDRILSCLRTPGRGDDSALELVEGGLRCSQTGTIYPHVGGVPSLCPEIECDSQNLLPSYAGVEEFGELVTRGSKNPFSSRLLKAVGYNKLVLDCGCGTGQLSHYLQLNNNHVLGVDLSGPCLALALEHKARNRLARAAFCRMDIEDMAVRDNSFDTVIAYDVLPYTADARGAFGRILKKLKPGGVIVVGLKNSYARFTTRDPVGTWRHSIAEVLEWFEGFRVSYLNCAPSILGCDGEDAPDLFAATSPGNAYQRALTQLGWAGAGSPLFTMIGRKKG